MAYRTAVLIIHDRHAAQDAVQDALVEVFQNIRRFEPRKSASFATWFYRIVVHRALNAARRRRNFFEFKDTMSSEPTPSEIVMTREDKERVWAAIQAMKPEYRAVIVLHYFHDFSIEEISGILRVRQGTVKSRLHKARKLIASRLREMDREAELKGAVCFDERP